MRQEDLEIISDADVISNVIIVQEAQPEPAHEFPVCHNRPNAFSAKKHDEPIDQVYALLSVWIPSFVQHLEHQRKSNTLIDNTEHEYVDVGLSELPVGPVNAQSEFALIGQKAENKTGNKVRVQAIACNKTLYPS